LVASAACAKTSQEGGASVPAPPVTRTTTVVASFDPAAGELPEGVATKDGFAYVGFAPLGEIAKVDLHGGTRVRFAKLPKPVPGKGFMTGLAFGPDGLLYAALVSFDPTVQPGIYRVGSAGGDAALFAKDPKMVFPNGLSFDAAGKLFVTDSAAGTIFQVTPSGTVSTWVSSPLLAGDATQCGGSGNPFPIGANGLVMKDGALLASNTDKGSIVRTEIEPDGSAGAPELATGPDCGALAGADGLTVDAHGDLIVLVNRQNKVVRVSKGGGVAVVAAGPAVDFPASAAWNGRTMISTNFALANASAGKPAKPGLLAISE
jgi:sugar lactone lactonase YvrE